MYIPGTVIARERERETASFILAGKEAKSADIRNKTGKSSVRCRGTGWGSLYFK